MTSLPDTPFFVVSGGSNSLLKDGWVDSLKKKYSADGSVNNLSIGAATTAMGMYRFLSAPAMPDKSIVVWEYSLNESNYFENGQSVELLLSHTRWFFEVCARRGFKVIPLILFNKSEMEGAKKNRYRAELFDLLNDLKLPYLDAEKIWKDEFPHIDLNDLYKDNPHYSTTTGFLDALAKKIVEFSPVAKVPRSDPAFDGKDIAVFYPNSEAGRPFVNRIINCKIHALEDEIRVDMKGRLLACFFISSRCEPAITFSSERGEIGPYSVQINPKDTAPARQLKHLLLWSPQSRPLQVNGTLRVVPSKPTRQKPIVQHTMSWRPVEDTEGDRGGLIAVLAEIDT
ncbi:hypothetical protein JJJ17_19520 [Paracoccus caeni]|uniref:SGNH/GDSL hydrolase family protein n=1 Tax=Paracoccus caeni TaxID=657651 RepID=A0A934SMU8_9RHOB|nr:hypothetical protein [Paracoccus caeni]MBK4218122.1 hypothetical protein [Paracoccus caeni]